MSLKYPLLLPLFLLLIGCNSNVNDDSKLPVETAFNPLTYSKIVGVEYSIQKQLREINGEFEDSELISEPTKKKISYLNSISARLATIRDEMIHSSGGYKEGTGGLLYPLSKDGVEGYFYQANDMNSFAHKEIDSIVHIVNKRFGGFLDCDGQDVFQFYNTKFFQNQEPDNSVPSDYLIKDKNAVEVILLLQNLQTQVEIIKLKIIKKYAC